MSDKEKLLITKKCFEDIVWMAIRYAHGRHTYAPSMVRDAVNKFKELYPDFKLKPDSTLEQITNYKVSGLHFESDYLNDLF